jgi:hypothetical protein
VGFGELEDKFDVGESRGMVRPSWALTSLLASGRFFVLQVCGTTGCPEGWGDDKIRPSS